MNGKKCKLARKIAERATVGEPAVAYQRAKKPNSKSAGFQIVLHPQCTRAKYKQIKKEYKNGK